MRFRRWKPARETDLLFGGAWPTRTAFLEKYATTLVEQHGRLLKEYVAVPVVLLGRLEELTP